MTVALLVFELALLAGFLYFLSIIELPTQVEIHGIAGPLIPIAAWAAAFVTRLWRYPRPLLALLAMTVAWYGAFLLPGIQERIVWVFVAAFFWLWLCWPERTGLVRRGTMEADRRIPAVATYLRTTDANPAEVARLALSLQRGPFPIHDGPWATTASLYRQLLLGRAGIATLERTTLDRLQTAARGYWQVAIEDGQLGPRCQPDAWDEREALRSYLDEFKGLPPTAGTLSLSTSPWDPDAAERLIAELRLMPFVDPVAREVGKGTVSLMIAAAAVAHEDAAGPWTLEQQATHDRVSELLDVLDTRASDAVQLRWQKRESSGGQ